MAELTTNQRRAIAALLTEPTIGKAAGKAGLCEATLYKYLRADAFKAELRARQDETINAATAALSGLAGEAIDTLRAVLRDGEATPAQKTRAALGILDHVQRLTAFADLEERIAQLEAQAQ